MGHEVDDRRPGASVAETPSARVDGEQLSDESVGDLKSFVTYKLARLQSHLNAQAIRLLKTVSDLSLTEWRILAVTALADTITLSKLVRDTGLDKGQLSRAVTALVNKDYIRSTTNDRDLRQNLLRLTPRGRALHDRVLPIMRERQVKLTAGIRAEDLMTTLHVLDQLDHAALNWPGP